MQNTTTIILVLVAIIVALYLTGCFDKVSREGYRDPLYLNRYKMIYDWYPKSNGSIYGFPVRIPLDQGGGNASTPGGGWHLMSGYPYYDKAY